MEKYKQAKKLYAENKFESAVEYFRSSFNEEVLNEGEKIDCLSHIIKIQKLLNKKSNEFETEWNLAKFLNERGDHVHASEVLKKINSKKNFYKVSFELIETLLRAGSLSEAEEELLKLFKYLYKTKSYKRTEELYKYSQEFFRKNLKYEIFDFIARVERGDYQAFESLSKIDKDIICEVLLDKPFLHWRHSEKFIELIVTYGFQTRDYNLNKVSIKYLLESLLLGKDLSESILLTSLKYFLREGRKTICRLICNYAEEKGHSLPDEVTYKIDSLPEDKELDTAMDLAEDLLGGEGEFGDEEQKLADDIGLLRSMGEEEEANLLLGKLRRKNPDHTLVNESVGTELRIKPKSIEELEEEWERDSSALEIETKLQRDAVQTLNRLSKDDIKKTYKDLIVCFNTMNLFGVSENIIKLIEEESDEGYIEKDLAFQYLKIKTFIGLREYFKAYDLLTHINGSTPLPAGERLEFLYLQGEVARKLGRLKDSIKCYLLVKNINPNYRLVRQRLNSFG